MSEGNVCDTVVVMERWIFLGEEVILVAFGHSFVDARELGGEPVLRGTGKDLVSVGTTRSSRAPVPDNDL